MKKQLENLKKKMVKFLKNKKTALITTILAVCYLVTYVALLARPINYLSKYKSVDVDESAALEYVFKNDETFDIYIGGKKKQTEEKHFYFYVEDRGYIVLVDEQFTREEWANQRKFIIQTVEELNEETLKSNAFKISAFKLEEGKYTFKCASTIAFSIYGSVILLAVFALAGCSLYCFSKDGIGDSSKMNKEENVEDPNGIESIIKPSKKK